MHNLRIKQLVTMKKDPIHFLKKLQLAREALGFTSLTETKIR